MARTFNGSSQHLRNTSFSVIGTGPVTFACWAKNSSDPNDNRTLFSLDAASGAILFSLQHGLAETGNPVRIYDEQFGVRSANSTAGTSGTGTWFHAAGTRTSNADPTYQAFYNGGNKGTTTTSGFTGSSGHGEVGIGARKYSGGLGRYYPGTIAEAGIWNVVLSDDEIAQLAAGYSPMVVRPQSLVAYWPLFGRGGSSGNEEDWINGYTLTQSNSPTVEDHPRIIYPRRRSAIAVPSAAAAAPTISDLKATSITSTSVQATYDYTF